MNTIEKLKLYPQIPRLLKDLNNQLTTSISEKYNICVTAQLTGMPGSQQPGDPTYKAVERILTTHDKTINWISRQITHYLQLHADVSHALLALTPEEKKIIDLRCFSCRHWDEVSRSACYSTRQCHRLYDSGVEKIKHFDGKH